VARCPLEPRRSVYVVEAAGRCFLIGVGDGPMAVLAELEPDKLPKAEPARAVGMRFAEVLGRVLARPAPPAGRPAVTPSVVATAPTEAAARDRT
jgi:flagellar biogenesis protein FliO